MPLDIGPRIGIDGEAKYRAEINQIIAQAKSLSSEMRKVETSFTKETSAQQKAAAKAEVLNKQIAVQGDRVDKLNAMLEKSIAEKGKDATETLKWKQVVNEADAELNRLRAELDALPNSLQTAGQAMQEAGQKMQTVGQSVAGVGATLTRTVTAPIVAAGAASLKLAADFDAKMSKVQAISGATGAEMEALEAKAREMGASTKFSASEAGQAMEYMAMAGWKTEDMLDGISGIMDLAAASGEDLATTSDIVTDALTAFGLTAADSGHFADVLAQASSNANTNVALMGETFKYVAPVAGALGYTADDTAQAIGLMANSGIKASQAGTALRSMLTRMASPTAETKKAMQALGVSLTDSEGNMLSLEEVMQSLRKGFANLSEVEKTQAANAIAGKNAMSGLLAIVNASEDDYAKLSDAIDGADGAAQRMAKTMQDNLEGRLTALRSKAEEVGIGFGNVLVPAAEKLVDKLGDLADWLNSLDDEEREQIVRIAAITAAAGPALSVTGKAVSGTGKLVEAAGKLTEKLGSAGMATGTLAGAMGTAGPAIAGVAATVGALALAYKAWQGSASGIAADVEKSTAALADNHAKNEAAIADAETLAARVEELAGKESLSAQEKLELASAVDRLNAVMPGLNLAIDENTGNLDANSKAIMQNIDASLAQYKAEKNREELAEITEQYAENEEKLLKIQEERAKIQKRLEDPAKYGDSLDDLQNRLNNANEAEKSVMRTQEELAAQYDSLVNVNKELTGATDEAAESATSQEEATDALAAAVTEDAGQIATAEEQMAEAYQQAYDAAYKSLTGQQGLFDQVKEAQTASASEMAANLGQQAEAYSSYTANLVEATRLASESSNPYFAAIIQSIADMGMDGAGYLQELINAANTDSAALDAILANYGNMEANKSQLASTLAGIATGATGAFDGLNADISSASAEAGAAAAGIPESIAGGLQAGAGNVEAQAGELENIATSQVASTVTANGKQLQAAGRKVAGDIANGINSGAIVVKQASMGLGRAAGAGAASAESYRGRFVQAGRYLAEGFAIGMESQNARIQRAAASMAEAADAAVRAKAKIGSPSRVMIENGEWTGEGYAVGLENMVPRVTRAGQLMAGAAMYAASPGTISGIAGAVGGTSYDYGGFNITVNGAPGQDVNALADVVSRRINSAMRNRRAVFA